MLKPLKQLFILLLILSSCEKEIEIDTFNYKKVPVVNAIFSNKQPFFFNFSFTEVPKNNYSPFTDSVHVILYEDNIQILDTIVMSDTLATTIYPTYGNYKILVKIADYEPVVAYDTIPYLTDVIDATFKTGISIDNYGDITSEVTLTFTDPPHIENYYEIYNLNYDTENELIDSVLIAEGDKNYFPTTYFFSDKLFDGKTQTIKILKKGVYKDTKISLRSVSRNYYLYRKFWTRHYFNKPTYEWGLEGLIYKGEPINMFTNIENGYGIFAGYFQSDSQMLREIK